MNLVPEDGEDSRDMRDIESIVNVISLSGLHHLSCFCFLSGDRLQQHRLDYMCHHWKRGR